MKRLWFVLCLSMAWALGFADRADAQPAYGKQPERQRFCPVVVGQPITFASYTLRYRGIKIRFSSPDAARRFLREPSAYLDTEIVPQLKELALPDPLTEQALCPVYRDRRISSKDAYVWHDGKRVYLYDERAVRLWTLFPERYYDEEYLPQFREPPSVGEDEPVDLSITVNPTESY